jgi:hypothetical protein
MTRFHGCLSWSYDATAALGHEFAGAGLGYQWLPRSEAAGRFRTSDLAGHRPQADIALLSETMQFLAYAAP